MAAKRAPVAAGELALLEELKSAAERLGIRVREEALLREVGYRVRSGRCRIRDAEVIFLDRGLNLSAQIDVLVDELAGRPLEAVYLSPAARALTWDCGYARPAPTMAYTAASFAQILVDLNAWLLRPRASSAVAAELFAGSRSFHSSVSEPVIDLGLSPLWRRLRSSLRPLRAFQRGSIQQYLVYVLLTLCVLLAGLFSLRGLADRLLAW